jgi:hypothetical protein
MCLLVLALAAGCRKQRVLQTPWQRSKAVVGAISLVGGLGPSTGTNNAMNAVKEDTQTSARIIEDMPALKNLLTLTKKFGVEC